MFSPRLYKYRDSYILYIPTVHTFGTVNFTHSHDVSAPVFYLCAGNLNDKSAFPHATVV